MKKEPYAPDYVAALNFNEEGLIPTIAQDKTSGKILMLAWMNRQALIKTLDDNINFISRHLCNSLKNSYAI